MSGVQVSSVIICLYHGFTCTLTVVLFFFFPFRFLLFKEECALFSSHSGLGGCLAEVWAIVRRLEFTGTTFVPIKGIRGSRASAKSRMRLLDTRG